MLLLSVDDLHVHFRTDRGLVRAVNGLSFQLEKGKTLGIVGESGCGKSVTALAIMRLLPPSSATIANGRVLYQGRDILQLPSRECRKLRGNQLAMIFQDPMTSLNPFLPVSRQLTEVLEVHQRLSSKKALKRSIEMLERVGISDAAARVHCYPHEFSGGMRQRVMIAMSLLCEPDLLIADEPTTALDVTIQAQILELLRDLQREKEMTIMLITHDLGVVAGFADDVLVMYDGQQVEYAQTAELFRTPRHVYTQELLAAVPRLGRGRAVTMSVTSDTEETR
jgi:ABC-type dipeptide/oligopeptide/nickel transport system ATPase component